MHEKINFIQMSNNKKIIPDLRFPEFVNEGEWEEKEVGEIFEITRGYVLAMSLIKEKQSNEYLYPVFSSQTKNNGLAGFYKEYLYDNAITWTTDGANAGDVNFRSGKFYCTNVCGVLLNKKGFANNCIAELINSVSKKYVSYVGNPKLMNGVMSKIKIPIPSLKEQQKIASCFSSLDEVIAVHSQKLELLKEHKKGLMQNLFPQKGEKVPKLRFPEFVKEGEWKIEILGKLSKEITEKTKGRKYKLMSITSGYGLVSQIKKFGREIAGNSYDNYYVIKNCDFAYNKSSTKLFTEGEIAMFEDEEIGAVPNSIFTCFRFDQNIIYPFFAKYPFVNNLHGKWLRKFIAVGARANGALQVNSKDLFSIPFAFPSLKEQQKIAFCLSSLDALITAQAEKIEQLKLHKKGLMQGLFPKNS